MSEWPSPYWAHCQRSTRSECDRPLSPAPLQLGRCSTKDGRMAGWPKSGMECQPFTEHFGEFGMLFLGGHLARFLACSSTILEGWARAIQKIGQIDHHCWISTWLWMGKIGHCMALLHPCVYHHYPHEHSHFKGISVSPIFRQSHISDSTDSW